MLWRTLSLGALPSPARFGNGVFLFYNDLAAEGNALIAYSSPSGTLPDILGLGLRLATERTPLFILLVGKAVYTFTADIDCSWPCDQTLNMILVLATKRAGELSSLVPGHALLSFGHSVQSGYRQKS